MPTAEHRPAPEESQVLSSGRPVVSIVLPCRNEDMHVQREIRRIDRAFAESRYRYEIVAVNDNSADRTGPMLDDLARQLDNVRAVHRSDKHGYGAALKAGTLASTGRVVAWTDCDLTYPNEKLPDLVTLLLATTDCRQVIGARMVEAGRARPLRWAVKFIIRRLAQHRTRHNIPDLNSGMRVFFADDYTRISHHLPDDFLCSPSLTLSYMRQHWKLTYSPIAYYKRSGKSKFRPLRDTWALIHMVAGSGVPHRHL